MWVLAVALTAAAIEWTAPLDWSLDLLVVVALAFGANLLRRLFVGPTVGLSMVGVILLAAIALVGPLGSGLAGAISPLAQLGRGPWRPVAFNVAMVASTGLLGGLAFAAVLGPLPDAYSESAPAAVAVTAAGLIVADVVMCLANALLIAGIQNASRGFSVRSQIAALLTSSGPGYLASGVLAVLIYVLWRPADLGPIAAVMMLPSLWASRWALTQYGDEHTAHDRTLDALMTAIEGRAPGAATHAAEVAQLCEWIGEELNLPHRELQGVRTAGALHNLEVLAIAPTRPRGPRELLNEPVAALAGIGFLDTALPAIRDHHTRFDDGGVPRTAAVLAVADAYTRARVRALRGGATNAEARHTALGDVGRQRGGRLDPAVIDALGRALHRVRDLEGHFDPMGAPAWLRGETGGGDEARP